MTEMLQRAKSGAAKYAGKAKTLYFEVFYAPSAPCDFETASRSLHNAVRGTPLIPQKKSPRRIRATGFVLGPDPVQAPGSRQTLLQLCQVRLHHAGRHGNVAVLDHHLLACYGLLVILDHGDGYMSLYGHNQSLLKEVGDWVEADEAIANVGNSGGQQSVGLYFEIRHNGLPANPAKWCARPRRRG